MSHTYTSVKANVVATKVKVGSKFQSVPEGTQNVQLFVPRVSWLSSEYPTDLFSRPGTYESKIPKIDNAEHLTLRVALTIAGSSVTLVECERWFEQMDLIDPSNPSQPVQTHYDDTAAANLMTRASAGTQRAIFKTSNVEQETIGKYGPAKVIMPGTYYFYIPVMSSVFSNFNGMFLGDMPNELRLSLRVPSTIIASGAGTISSAIIQFGVEGHILNDTDRAIYRNRYQTSSAQAPFLQPHRTTKQVVLACGSDQNFIDLNDVRGVISHHMILIRPVGPTNVSDGRSRYYNIGDAADARIQLVDNQGTSITGSLPSRFMRQHLSTQFDNDWVSTKPVYLLQYCENINRAINGVAKGGRYFFPQSGDRIQFTLPPASTPEQQTVTFSAAPAAAGFYRLRFRGEESATLVGNATPAAMKAAFEAMRGVAARGLTVTFSAAASAGTSLVATISDPEGVLDGDVIEFICYDGFAASSSTARTVAGIPGLPASGTYQVDIYSYQMRTAVFSGTMLYSMDALVAPPSFAQ